MRSLSKSAAENSIVRKSRVVLLGKQEEDLEMIQVRLYPKGFSLQVVDLLMDFLMGLVMPFGSRGINPSFVKSNQFQFTLKQIYYSYGCNRLLIIHTFLLYISYSMVGQN